MSPYTAQAKRLELPGCRPRAHLFQGKVWRYEDCGSHSGGGLIWGQGLLWELPMFPELSSKRKGYFQKRTNWTQYKVAGRELSRKIPVPAVCLSPTGGPLVGAEGASTGGQPGVWPLSPGTSRRKPGRRLHN